MSDPMIFSVLLVVLLGLLALGVWVAVALIGMALVALVFFSNAPQGWCWPQRFGDIATVGPWRLCRCLS